MRFRNTKTGAIIDVKSDLKGPWEKISGGDKPAAAISEEKTAAAEDVKKKPGRKAKK